MNSSRLVSVVIPSHNHARFVSQAIRSVLDQDYPTLELIVVDDGSSDDSVDVIQSSLTGDRGHIGQLIIQENAGAHVAIMRGLRAARGDILTILNSDDCYEPSRLTRMMAAVPARGDFIAFSKLRFIDDEGEALGAESGIVSWYRMALREAAECPTVGYGLLRNNFSVTSGNLVFTREIYNKVSGFNSYRMCHDWDFLIRAMHHVEPIYVQEILGSYRVHKSNTLHSTQHLLLREGVPSINAFVALGLAARPPNTLCPGWVHWPLFFDYFIARYHSWFSDRPIRDFLEHEPPSNGAIELLSWGQVASLGGPDCGFIVSPNVPGTALDAFAFAREAALREGRG